MGIPGFATWLRQRYPEAFSSLSSKTSFDNIYIDLQSTLHGVTRKARTRHGFHAILHRRLDDYINTLGPTQRVVLAMDGPAPLAKLFEQRRRRKRESDRSEYKEKIALDAANDALSSRPNDSALSADDVDVSDEEDLDSTDNIDDNTDTIVSNSSNRIFSTNPYSEPPVSPLFLTTGTVFMLEVHNSLTYYICHRLSDPRYRHISFELSDSTVKGEGELKILSRLLHSDKERQKESHVVVGGDSDLLIMAIASGQRHVTLWDDVPNRKRKGSSAFDRDRLEAVWKKQHLGMNASQADIADLGLNLALLAILSSGNDYLPGVSGLSLKNKGRPGLWSLYLDMRNSAEWKNRSLIIRSCVTGCTETTSDHNGQTENSRTRTNGDVIAKSCPGGARVTIDREVLGALLQRYSAQRLVMPSARSSTGGANNNNSVNNKVFSREKQVSGAWNWGMAIDNEQNGKFDGMLASLDEVSVKEATTPSSSPDVASEPWRQPPDNEAFIAGLEWTLSMYATGSLDDYRFSYTGSAPLLHSLLETLQKPKSDDVMTIDNNNSSTLPDSAMPQDAPKKSAVEGTHKNGRIRQPLVPAACALALLPARSRRQAATPLRHLMDADSPVAEIFAVCRECQHLASELRTVGRQMDEVRSKLAELQTKFDSAGPDADSVHDATEGDLVQAAEVFESAQEKLKQLLRDISRSQIQHYKEKHPFKPFPTDALEAAVAAIPRESYPPRERRLAKFGREMLFRSVDDESVELKKRGNGDGASNDDGNEESSDNRREYMPFWLKDASRFAAAYPRIGNQTVIREAVQGVVQEILPLHPYMQPGAVRINSVRGGMRNSGRSSMQPTALFMACQMRRVSSGREGSPFGRTTTVPSFHSHHYYNGNPAVARLSSMSSGTTIRQAMLKTCARVLPRLKCLF